METMRLRAIQMPSRVEELLDSFISSSTIVPSGSRKIRRGSDLPVVLQDLVVQSTKADREWSCWTDDHRIWLFTAEMSLDLSRERGCPVLQVNSYAEDGVLIESGSWLSDRDGKWRRCAD